MVSTSFGSEKLYEDRFDEDDPSQLAFSGLEGVGDVSPHLVPTLDKLLAGMDTAPVEDDGWLIPEPEPAPQAPRPNPAAPPTTPRDKLKNRFLNRKARRAAARAAKTKQPGGAREAVSICVELVGIACLSSGFALLAAWAGLICLGLCLILVGVAMSRDTEGT